jgi:hypothetical protein
MTKDGCLTRRPEAKLRHRFGRVTFPLHGKGDALSAQGQVADRVLPQVGQFDLVQQAAILGKKGKVRPHIGKVQFGAVHRVGLDTAVGHGKPAIGQKPDLMRTDPVAGPVSQPGIVFGVPQADAAFGRLGHHFRGHQDRPIGGKRTVAVELQSVRRGQAVPGGSGAAVDHQGKGAGAAGEGDRFGAGRMGGGGMAAPRQRDPEQRLPGSRKPVQDEPLALFPGGKEGRAADFGPCQARRAGGGKGGQESAASHVSRRPPS